MTEEASQETPPETSQEAAEARQFLISPGPHLWKGLSVSQIMYLVVYALLLPAGAGVYFFGHRALSVMGVSIGAAILTEYICKKMRGQPFIMDGSAIVTGLLLALVLPPTLPLWMVAIGSVFAIAIAKEAFGGLGHNIFNPALAARAFMSVSFPMEMTTWVRPMGFGADAVTCATPLSGTSMWQPFVMDGSALVTGLLFALVLPPTIALWMVALGSVFAIAIVKEAFGGLGHNIFNPALAARAFISVSFPMEMTTWVKPMGFGADAVTCASPLSGTSIWQPYDPSTYRALFLGNTAGSIGETSALLILIGGAFLLARGIINWRIPAIYIGVVALIALGFGEDPLFHILAGGLMLGAFFMATDYVTSPLTNRGKIIFAVGLGLLTMIIRRFAGMPEGVCYSILFMNAITPLIDRYTKLKPYGLQKKVAHAG